MVEAYKSAKHIPVCYSISLNLTPFTLVVMFCCRGNASLTFDKTEVFTHDGEVIEDKADRKLSSLAEREDGHFQIPCDCLYVPLCTRISNGYHLVPIRYRFGDRYL